MGMAERIKERRTKMNLTQDELAQKLGLQKSAIAKYENGRVSNIKRSVIAKMAKILECDPCYLLAFDDSNDMTPLENTPTYEDLISKEAHKLNQKGKIKLLDTDREMTCNPLYNPNYKVEVAAAHERTDIEVTEEMRKHDDNIMMDDSEWE